jgi:tRNA threonylcarbamoyladenosine biosynthesis protein TsaE
MAIYKINNLEDLKKLASSLFKKLKAGDVVALSGELGAGKTTLVQMLAKEFGIKETVQSPSFNIFKIYPVQSRHTSGVKNFCHVDLYRLKEFDENIGFEEYILSQDSICFIEWAEKIKKSLPKNTIWVKIEIKEGDKREIEIK